MRAVFSAYDWLDNISGPATWLGELLPGLVKLGVDCHVDLLVWDQPGPLASHLQSAGISMECTTVADSTEKNVRQQLCRLADQKMDVFVPNNCVPSLLAAKYVRKCGIPTVAVLHSDDEFYSGVIDVFVAGHPDDSVTAVVSVSETLHEMAKLKATGYSEPVLVPYGVRVSKPQVQKSARSVPFVVLYAGRFSEHQKRISDVARVISRIVNEVPGTCGVLVGDGPDSATVREILREALLDGRVRLTGRLSPQETQQQMMQADAILLLSDFEGLPIALLEGMANGLVPIVSPMRSGISELIRDQENGIVVGDRSDAVVSAIRSLLCEQAKTVRLSSAARQTILQNYSSSMCASRWESLLRRLSLSRSTEATIPNAPVDLMLPAVHPALAAEDRRQSPITTTDCGVFRKLTRRLAELRRRVSQLVVRD